MTSSFSYGSINRCRRFFHWFVVYRFPRRRQQHRYFYVATRTVMAFARCKSCSRTHHNRSTALPGAPQKQRCSVVVVTAVAMELWYSCYLRCVLCGLCVVHWQTSTCLLWYVTPSLLPFRPSPFRKDSGGQQGMVEERAKKEGAKEERRIQKAD